MRTRVFQLEAFFEKYEHLPNMNVLGASDAETSTVNDLLALARGKLDLGKTRLAYEEVKGRKDLRDVIAKSYKRAKISRDNVLVTVGATEAILLALHTLVRPGDRALVCWPAYQALEEMVEAAGGEVIRYKYLVNARQNGFAPDLDTVHAALSSKPRPKVLIINTPHNPTGHAISGTALRKILALARRSATRVIVDEVFSGIRVGSRKPVPSALELAKNAIIIGSLSKVYGLPGLRVGWLAGPKDFIEEAKNLRFYTSLTPPSVVQLLGKIALQNRRRILARTQQNVDQNYRYVQKWLKHRGHLFDWVEPQGGLVMLLKLKAADGDAKFAELLARRQKVLLIPCSVGFGMSGDSLRLGLGGPREQFRDGLRKVDLLLESGAWH